MKTLCLSLLLLLAGAGALRAQPGSIADAPGARDWSTDTTSLLGLVPEVLTDSAGVVQYRWCFADIPSLWREAAEFATIARYRRRVKELVPDTRPLELIAANIRMIGTGERANDPIMHGRIGTIREMNALETHLFAYEARRFDMLDHPTEFHAFILRKSSVRGDSVAVYFVAGGELFPPKPNLSVERIERDTADGWRLWGHLHNHTFDFTPGKGWYAVTAPSNSDLQYYQALREYLGMQHALVTNGFHTIELRADELRMFDE
jgi:hypothetical protein